MKAANGANPLPPKLIDGMAANPRKHIVQLRVAPMPVTRAYRYHWFTDSCKINLALI